MPAYVFSCVTYAPACFWDIIPKPDCDYLYHPCRCSGSTRCTHLMTIIANLPSPSHQYWHYYDSFNEYRLTTDRSYAHRSSLGPRQGYDKQASTLERQFNKSCTDRYICRHEPSSQLRPMANTGPSASVLKRTYDSIFSVRMELAALALGSKPSPRLSLSLMGLPSELRLEVFDYILNPGNVYIRWSAKAAAHDIRFANIIEDSGVETTPVRWLAQTSRRARRGAPTNPQTQLFLVSKQLRDEAMQYYLSRNTFHVMGADCALPYLS